VAQFGSASGWGSERLGQIESEVPPMIMIGIDPHKSTHTDAARIRQALRHNPVTEGKTKKEIIRCLKHYIIRP